MTKQDQSDFTVGSGYGTIPVYFALDVEKQAYAVASLEGAPMVPYLWAYTAIDHCTHKRWSSQAIARSYDHLASMLRAIHGSGFELLVAAQLS